MKKTKNIHSLKVGDIVYIINKNQSVESKTINTREELEGTKQYLNEEIFLYPEDTEVEIERRKKEKKK